MSCSSMLVASFQFSAFDLFCSQSHITLTHSLSHLYLLLIYLHTLPPTFPNIRSLFFDTRTARFSTSPFRRAGSTLRRPTRIGAWRCFASITAMMIRRNRKSGPISVRGEGCIYLSLCISVFRLLLPSLFHSVSSLPLIFSFLFRFPNEYLIRFL